MSHKYDCWLTPPCAAVALGDWLWRHTHTRTREWPTHVGDLLDPFAGAGSLLLWAGDVCTDARFDLRFAFELDTRWAPELRQRVSPFLSRIGRDSFGMPWTPQGSTPSIITNPPFGRTREAVERCRAHAYEHRRWACVLMRTDWWQHEGRNHLAPDHFLALQWRPVFGLNKHGQFSTDYAGYVWCVWDPMPTGACRMAWLARPEVPKEMVAEHRRLARMAHEMGREMAAQGA